MKPRVFAGAMMLFGALSLISGCRDRSNSSWDWKRMRSQPRYKPYGGAKGNSMMRHPPEGTMSRESIAEEEDSNTVASADSIGGKNRYAIFCSACHGERGDGNSAVGESTPELERLSLVSPSARLMTDSQLMDLLRSGKGRMPSFSSQLSAHDRRSVIDYVKKLQQNGS